ncbi:hypothetical protein GCM10027176_51490 [Actinoallomurus bryophytorum]|uniref:Helix-turn-helix domain-containing protein n=1 Tax=Actinoallomurus bryophytorum TaxID=1490222 RepID=A0A543CHP7_9ACTN|nr:hypothetical protein [Actinoallomurus bryophytorum]TQL96611.1 hypothetical protein FB559_2150 [Actinoallomurus bryophytorum]
MARLTEAERTKICDLYKQRRSAVDSQRIDEAQWRTFKYVARQVRRHPLVIRDALVAKGVIDPRPPNDVSEPEMRKVVADYLSGISIRACVDRYPYSYSTIRKVLLYKRVELRGRGPREDAGT